MAKLYLHIGHGKTGTSSIQRYLSENRQALRSTGLLYPETGLSANHHHLLAQHKNADLPETIASLYRDLLQEISQSGCDRVLVSSEQFCYCKPDYVAEVQKLLAGCDVTVVYCVRDQVSLIESAYMQKIKSGNRKYTGTLEDFFQRHAQAFVQQGRIALWEQAFGRDALRVYAYHPQEDSVARLFRVLQWEMPSVTPDHLENRSLPLVFADLVRAFDELCNSQELRQKFVQALFDFMDDRAGNPEQALQRCLASCDDIVVSGHNGPAGLERYRRQARLWGQKYIASGLSKEMSSLLRSTIYDYYAWPNRQFAETYLQGEDRELFLQRAA